MKVIGANAGVTTFGKPLKDGSLSVFSDGKPAVYVEEKYSGKKYDGGFENALNQARVDRDIRDVEIAVISSCCEPLISDMSVYKDIFGCEAVSINHHLSHAIQTFQTSQFEDALVLVCDAGGNVLEDFDNDRKQEWWRYRREQVTAFSASSLAMSKIGDFFSEPYDIGFGEFWRYATYFCGFDSSNYASKVMELAAFRKNDDDLYLFEIEKQSPVRNDPPNKQLGRDLFEIATGKKLSVDTIEEKYSVASWAQASLENGLLDLLRRMKKETGHRRLCLTGGVALNCKAVHAIRTSSIFEEVFVGFCPGDKGQSIGNMLYGIGQLDSGAMRRVKLSPFMTPERKYSLNDIEIEIGENKNQWIISRNYSPKHILKLIQNGLFIATCTGNGEVGARALGNTSILANPALKDVKKKLNKIKQRADYTPVAPAIGVKSFQKYFSTADTNMKFMSELVFAEYARSNLPDSIFHKDGSVRVQLIESNGEGYLSRLYEEFLANEDHDKDFIILNTSFNRGGKPMPQLLKDAIKECIGLELDGLVLPRDVFLRKKNARIEALLEASVENTQYVSMTELLENKTPLEEKFGTIENREKFSLFENYINWMLEGRKVTTIRYVEDGISLPSSEYLPMVMTKNFKQAASFIEDHSVRCYGVTIKRFGDLDIVDAQRDGFEQTSHLKNTLNNIYPSIQDNSLVTINFIEIVN